MKSLITAVLLFAAILVFIISNAFFINGFFKKTDDLLLRLPQTAHDAENLSESEKEAVSVRLSEIEKEWKSKENYVMSVLEHEKASDFSERLLSTKTFFEAEDYGEYASSLAALRNVTKHIIFDEGITLGNVL